MKYLYVLILLASLSCTTNQVRPVQSEDLLFPNGRYQQSVDVDVTAPQHKQDFDFDCVVQKSPDEVLFYGYNNFGFSLFKISEKSGQPIEAESSIPQIKKNQEFFVKVFKLVKTIFSLQKSDSRLKDQQIDLEQDGIKAHVTFSQVDALGIPLKIDVSTAGQYEVKIKTSSYKLKTETVPR
ncbi:MAG: hypothetical protein H7326_04475 [Bdellovibrionaceae bacterium]|nr:hypothetical protein [Pseudobdellovibrionaceae bacterium]